MFVILDAPPDHINIHIREGNVLAMQGEAMMTKSARKTAFQLLAVISSSETSTGEVFLDDGEELKMGGGGERWSWVRFHGNAVGNILTVGSQVMKGEFASTQKWIIEKVTFLGVRNVKNLKGYKVITKGTKLHQNPVTLASFDANGRFATVVISGLSMLIGEDFMIELSLNSGIFQNRKNNPAI